MRELILKYLLDNLSSTDEERLIDLLQNPKNKLEFENFIRDEYKLNLMYKSSNLEDSYIELWDKIENKQRVIPLHKRPLFKYVAAAATVLLLVSLQFIFDKKDTLIENPTIVNADIKTGTAKATLTLEDGSEITLEKGQEYTSNNLVSNGEELIYSDDAIKSEVAYNYLTIPRGGEYYVKLSDGTQVWLNSESQLKYPVNFLKGQTREVELVYGEAYFDVSPSKMHNGEAFRVNQAHQSIQVLGTEFNVKAYQDEHMVYTTLVEGKVAISRDSITRFLSPGQQSRVSKSNGADLTIDYVRVSDEISWVKGDFVFKRKTLGEIFKVLERWYDVEIEITNASLKDIEFTGEFGKDQSIYEILAMIKETKIISAYGIEQNKVKIK